jgi:2-dehydro-3-deoxygalactonokinase
MDQLHKEYLLSCDWGTSSLRLRLASTVDGAILAEVSSAEGIAAIFNQWEKSNSPAADRLAFYLEILKKHIASLESTTGCSLAGIKVIISGMASSSIGFVDVPYSELPFAIDGDGINTARLEATANFEHDVLVIGGVKTASDVIRGEETQLLGSVHPQGPGEEEWFIFPGTHSKHIQVKDNQVVDFKTYMTGEVFHLLSEASILRNSVEQVGDSSLLLESFVKGVQDAQTANLLNAVFRVRTNQLFGLNNKAANYNYLSGLLIGAELQDLSATDPLSISLVAGGNLAGNYHTALTELFSNTRVTVLSSEQGGQAVVLGQLKIAGKSDFLHE